MYSAQIFSLSLLNSQNYNSKFNVHQVMIALHGCWNVGWHAEIDNNFNCIGFLFKLYDPIGGLNLLSNKCTSRQCACEGFFS